jgi:hypothetical protein
MRYLVSFTVVLTTHSLCYIIRKREEKLATLVLSPLKRQKNVKILTVSLSLTLSLLLRDKYYYGK